MDDAATTFRGSCEARLQSRRRSQSESQLVVLVPLTKSDVTICVDRDVLRRPEALEKSVHARAGIHLEVRYTPGGQIYIWRLQRGQDLRLQGQGVRSGRGQ